MTTDDLTAYYFAFLRCGGVLTLADFAALGDEQRSAMADAYSRHEAMTATLFASAIQNPAAVFALADGGAAQRRDLVARAANDAAMQLEGLYREAAQ